MRSDREQRANVWVNKIRPEQAEAAERLGIGQPTARPQRRQCDPAVSRSMLDVRSYLGTASRPSTHRFVQGRRDSNPQPPVLAEPLTTNSGQSRSEVSTKV